jgi:hypothetical protein
VLTPQGDLTKGALKSDIGLLREEIAAGVGVAVGFVDAAGFANIDVESLFKHEDSLEASAKRFFAAQTQETIADASSVDSGCFVTHLFAVLERGINRAVKLNPGLGERGQAEETGEREGERFFEHLFILERKIVSVMKN